MKTFLEGEILTAADLNANFNETTNPPANTEIINGVQHERSGTFTTGNLTLSATGNMYYAMVDTTHLPAPPPGWTYGYTVVGTNMSLNAWASMLSNGRLAIVSSTPNGRTVTIAWQLIKE